jgi:lipopolysaccharide/colanic/teichoic acid biosynthesis glycosyltransferase
MIADWPRSLHTLYTPAQLQVILRRARLRVERSDGQLAVVVFELADDTRVTRWRLRRLARLVLRRARVTDDVGWITKTQVCAILPDTGPYGAYHMAEGVRGVAADRKLDVRYTIYCYPDDDTDTPTGGSGGGRRGANERLADGEPAAPSASASPDLIAPAPFRGGAASPTAALERRRLIAFVNRGMRAGATSPVRSLVELLRDRLPVWKRAMDVVGASIGLTLALPVMAVAALMIRASSPGPVLFRQPRSGIGGERFTIFKFRTMVPNAESLKPGLRALSEQDGPAFKMTDDPRVTWIGRFLRATSLDELPQFWNVLVGNMSLVGPRPLPIDEADACDLWHRRRLDVMPGLTCIWQVRGRSRVSFDDWMRMDMEYIRRRSPLFDLKILLLTVPAVVLRRGAH